MRDRILLWMAELAWRRPRWIIIIAIVAAVASALYASVALRLNANTDDLIAPEQPYFQAYKSFIREFGDLEHIYAVVENHSDAARAEAAVDALTARLKALPNLAGVHGYIEPQEQLRLATRAMPESELEGLALAAGAFPVLQTGDANRVIAAARQSLAELIQSGSKWTEEQQRHSGAAAVLLAKAIAAAVPDSAACTELAAWLGESGSLRREFFTSDTGRFFFITIVPNKDYSTLSVIEEPLRQIRSVIDEARREFPGVNIGLTGKPVLQADEMATTNRDMTIASALAFVLCALLFMWSFGGVWKPLLAVVAFACAGAWTYGFATIAVGQLNLLSIVFMLVLIGVGLDYGVHMLSRYRESRVGNPLHESVRSSVLLAGRGNITGALTSSIVFFMAYFTSFQGLRELGLIAGGGLLLCVLAMTLVLPALLVMFGAREKSGINRQSSIDNRQSRRSLVFDWLHDHPATVLAATAVITAALLLVPGKWRFEQNLLKLQAVGLDSVEWEHRILDDSAAASWFGAVIAEDQETALQTIEQGRERHSIGAVRSVFDVIQPQSQSRDVLRRALHEPVYAISLLEAQTHANANGAFKEWEATDLAAIAGALDLMAIGAARQAPDEARNLKELVDVVKSLTAQLNHETDSAANVRARVNATIAQIGESLRTVLEGDQAGVREALPEAVRARSISPGGMFLIMLHPKDDVWEYEPMARFIADMRAVDPTVTGAPITHFESLDEMRRAFLLMAILAVLVIGVIVWIDFRDWRCAVLALVPTILGLIWLFEVMAAMEISFNLANFFSVPILIGLGVDGSVHVLHRHLENGSMRHGLGATRKAVIVTALTTTIGFGCVMLAHHRGLRSLGQVMAIGSVATLLATIIVLPALLAVLERWRRRG